MEIVASSVFHKDKDVQRKITPKEMGRVLDYQEDKQSEITEDQIDLLTKNEETPGEIIYSALFSLSPP